MNEMPSFDSGTINSLYSTYAEGEGYTLPLPRRAAAPHVYRPGDLVDHVYELKEIIGRGSMGVVFSCRHNVLDMDCAIKLLDGEDLTAERWERCLLEAKALARMKHAGIVGILNMGVDDGHCPYFVMELLSGESLDTLLRRSGTLPAPLVLDLFTPVADALHCAHQKNIIHRDIKPSNLMLVRDGAGRIDQIKIVDFGIARFSTGVTFQEQSQTKTGFICGTPLYMSPEQCQGRRADARSDVYSFGCTLFEALTGEPPFRGNNVFHTFMMHQNLEPPNLSSVTGGAFPPGLEEAMKKMLAKDPDERYRSMAQVKHDLERIRAGKTILADKINLSAKLHPTGKIDLPAGRTDVAADANECDLRAWYRWENLLSAFALLLVFGLGAALVLYLTQSANKPAPAIKLANGNNANVGDSLGEDIPLQLGATADDVDGLLGEPTCNEEQAKLFHEDMLVYLNNPSWLASPFRVQKPADAFVFPDNPAMGAVQIDSRPPVLAHGRVFVPPGAKVTMYLPRIVADDTRLMDKFGHQGIHAVNAIFSNPEAALEKLSHWQDLEELCLFNPLIKSLPSCEKWDESTMCDADLAAIDRFGKLRMLGLCGPNVTGGSIARMRLLNKISALRLKRISNLSSILVALPKHTNIKELWLIGQELKDDEIEILASNKNIETLRIRRSLLTPASLATFRRMPALKTLWLDKMSWSEKDREMFREAIPGCHFEKAMDCYYWKIVREVH